MNIPIGHAANGLPLGLQLVAAYRQDAHLLRAGRWIEIALGR